jgi:hypothetical protein
MTPNRFERCVPCLDCGRGVDTATAVDKGAARPTSGDIAICFYCGHVMAYADDEVNVRPLTDAEIVEIAGDPDIVRVSNAIAAVKWREP